MRAIVFFDLPTLTSSDRREFNRFRKFLLKNGFIMMQESVYIKLALNPTVLEGVKNNLRVNKPKNGLVQLLAVTEKQFAEIEYVCGQNTSDVINNEERLIVI